MRLSWSSWHSATRSNGLSGNAQNTFDTIHVYERDTAVGSSKKRWWNWGGGSASELNCYFPHIYFGSFCRYRDAGYGKRLGDTVDNISNIDVAKRFFARESNGVVAISGPDNRIHRNCNWACPACNINFEMRMACSGHSDFIGRHNAKAFAVLPQPPGKVYKSLPAWLPPCKCSQLLSIPSPPLFAYYSSAVLKKIFGASDLWHPAITEYGVLAVLPFSSLCMMRLFAISIANSCVLLLFRGILFLNWRDCKLVFTTIRSIILSTGPSPTMRLRMRLSVWQRPVGCHPTWTKALFYTSSIWSPSMMYLPQNVRRVRGMPMLTLLLDEGCH